MDEPRELQTPAAVDREGLQGMRAHILGAVFTLLGIGLVLIYSASAIRAGGTGWEMQFIISQACWLVIGLGGLVLTACIDYRRWQQLWPLLLLLCLGLLAAVRVPGVGAPVRGAYRWFRFGAFSVQPSEIAKLGLILVMAALLARVRTRALPFWRGFVPATLVLGAAVGLIAVEPDFGTAALVATVLSSLLLVAGARWWHVAVLVAAGAPPALYYGLTRLAHIRQRWDAWVAGANTGAGWQPFMSKVSLGSGGPTGVGLGAGHAKLYYLPDAHTDFILAIAGQELGLVATLLVVALFAVFVCAGMRLVRQAPDRFGALAAFGITMMIGLQAAFNIAVVTASIPPKGISLPFVSFGGSGLCISLAGVGILLSIIRRATTPQDLAVEDTETSGPLTWRERVARGDIAFRLALVAAGRGGPVSLTRPFNLPRFLIAILQSLRIQRAFQPQVCIALGGYAAAAPGVAARLLHAPLVALEQNAVPGRTNRWLARWAETVHLQFSEAAPGFARTRARIEPSGSPIREEIAALAAQPPMEGPSLLVLGGSQGATRLNDAVLAAAPALAAATRAPILHLAGPAQEREVRSRYADLGVDAEVYGFTDDMPSLYRRARFAISRAGAGSLAELAAAGIPALLVPLPEAMDDHQRLNAACAVRAGAAVHLEQSACTADALGRIASDLWNDAPRRHTMAIAMRRMARPEAAVDIARSILDLTDA